MEQKIRAYEKYLEKETAKKLTPTERAAFIKHHYFMVANFQHERLIHLLVTLFFVSITLVALIITTWITCLYGFLLELLSLYILTGLLVVLTACYIKHYYFLENHIQKLYDYTKKII